jgi:hypothetical protein
MTSHDDVRPEPVKKEEGIREHGLAFYQAALKQGGSHYDLEGEPYWLPEAWEVVLLSIEIEDRRQHGHIT